MPASQTEAVRELRTFVRMMLDGLYDAGTTVSEVTCTQ